MTIFYTRLSNVIFCVIAMMISFLGVNIIMMNTFASAIRCSVPFAAYGSGLVMTKATKDFNHNGNGGGNFLADPLRR